MSRISGYSDFLVPDFRLTGYPWHLIPLTISPEISPPACRETYVMKTPSPLPINLSGLFGTPVPTPATHGSISRPAALLDYSAIKHAIIIGHDPVQRRDVRCAFGQLKFPEQAALIAARAKEELEAAGIFIKLNWLSTAPSAAQVWRVLSDQHCSPRDAGKIAAFFPQLKERMSAERKIDHPGQTPSEKLAVYFGGLYRFWVESLYPYGRDGQIGYKSITDSPARLLTQAQMSEIDRLTELPTLGYRLKEYADFLAHNYTELVLKS
jgi:hypothetical protein